MKPPFILVEKSVTGPKVTVTPTRFEVKMPFDCTERDRIVSFAERVWADMPAVTHTMRGRIYLTRSTSKLRLSLTHDSAKTRALNFLEE